MNSIVSKEECHLKSDKVFSDYEYILKSLLDGEEDNIQKTMKLFTQIDSISKSTESSIEKSTQMLDQVLDKKLSILSTVKNLKDIQQSLDLDTIVKNNWHTSQ